MLCWFVGEDMSRAVFFSDVVRLKMLGVLVGLDQKDSYAARWRPVLFGIMVGPVEVAAPVVDIGSCMFTDGFAGDDAFLLCSLRSVADPSCWHHGLMLVQTVQRAVWRCRYCRLLTWSSTPLLWRKGASFSLSVHSCFLAEVGAAGLVDDNMFLAGFAGFVAPRVVFPLIVGALVVAYGGIFKAGFAGDDAFHATFLLFVGRLKSLGIVGRYGIDGQL